MAMARDQEWIRARKEIADVLEEHRGGPER